MVVEPEPASPPAIPNNRSGRGVSFAVEPPPAYGGGGGGGTHHDSSNNRNNYGAATVGLTRGEDPTWRMDQSNEGSTSQGGGGGSGSSNSGSNDGGDEVHALPHPHTRGHGGLTAHEAMLNASRRRSLQSSKSLRHGSLRDLRQALSRQPSVLSIYSPLEVRRADSGLPSRSLTCVVINLIGAGYVLLPHGTSSLGRYSFVIETLEH
jgi:hypothetical protein